MMTVNLLQNQKEISGAWNKLTQDDKIEHWALFGYEGSTNVIKLISNGSGGLKELIQEFHCSLIQYALCRIIDNFHGINKLILINWQGESAPLTRKGLCASHVSDVSNYFKGCNQTITLRNEDEATVEYIMEQVLKCSSRITLSNTNQIVKNSSSNLNTKALPSDNSKLDKEDITIKLAKDRKSFWEEQEREENQRISEEKKRAAEKQAQYERERKAYQEAEAKKISEATRDREKLIDATRQADKHSQQSTNSLLNNNINDDDDDDRVGRRSEILRLERSQETCTLISKGSLKDKKAIFEQACNQKTTSNVKPINGTNSLLRKSSSTLVSQRLSAFQSTFGDQSSNVGTKVDNLSEPTQENILKSSQNEEIEEVIEKKVNAIKIENDEIENHECTTQVLLTTSNECETAKVNLNNNNNVEIHEYQKSEVKKEVELNGSQIHSSNEDSKSNQNNTISEETSHESSDVNSSGIRAKALFDYQAGDDTEISFDPDDIIGFIEKVDKGWWHGRVLTGAFANQVGLFPSNYVEEL